MPIRHFFILLLCASFMYSTFATAAKPALNKNGITVWKTPIPNTNILGFKATTTINASPKQVLAVIMDTTAAPEWIPNTRNAKSLTKEMVNGLPKTHITINMPFPLKDRELTVSSQITQDAQGNIRVTDKLSNSTTEKTNPKHIKISNYSGSWQLDAIHARKTRITISGHADPSGSIPSWVANLFVTQQPYDMLRNLKKQVTKSRYKNPKIPYVKIK